MALKAFVIMPFSDEYEPIYESFIKVALENAGYKSGLAKDINTHRNILQDIIGSIVAADLIVADLTEVNTNVYYELGIAHARRKPVILLAKALDKIPFDLQPYRKIVYSTHFARIEEAKTELTELAKGASEDRIHFGNPYTDFTDAEVAEGDTAIDEYRIIVGPPVKWEGFDITDIEWDDDHCYILGPEIEERIKLEPSRLGPTLVAKLPAAVIEKAMAENVQLRLQLRDTEGLQWRSAKLSLFENYIPLIKPQINR